jgi:hypothetical protein
MTKDNANQCTSLEADEQAEEESDNLDQLVDMFLNDEKFKNAQVIIQNDITKSDAIALKIVTKLNEEISNKNIKIKHAILALAHSLSYIVQELYSTKKEYEEAVRVARELTDKMVAALEDPQPCGKCKACNEGRECEHPIYKYENTQTRFIPLAASALIEYDYWIKTVSGLLDEK